MTAAATVALAALGTALVTGLGAVPFALVRSPSRGAGGSRERRGGRLHGRVCVFVTTAIASTPS
ncbi:MAG: hypothetical protein M3312_06805 [Actinomycetota bacterium]|nr:hypothetical protein [Actinomycetota bacterium]